MRNHTPITIEDFNGLWKRGDVETTPPDHFSNCNNIQFTHSGFETRDGISLYLNLFINIRRIYTFVQETGESLLILDSAGNIYDSTYGLTVILHVTGMTDFAYVSIAGRAYLSPHNSVVGLENEFIYVYKGDGTPARKAGGSKPITSDGAMIALETAVDGHVEEGVHIFGVIYETDTGFLSAVSEQLSEITAIGGKEVDFTLPESPSPYVTKVHVVATKAIDPDLYNHDKEGYQFFRIPGATVVNGVNVLQNVSFFDAELLEDVTHLQDLFSELPACVNLTTYHGRLVCVNSYTDISLLRISYPGEPEAISEIDGLVVIPLDGTPLTNAQEFRDVLYVFKQIRTFALVDNQDVPSSWTVMVLDQGVGCCVHGIAFVLNSGGVNVDYLIITDYSGVMLFNGTYSRPELSWKIRDYWFALKRGSFNNIQIINDSLSQIIYITLPQRQMLIGDYSNGLDPKSIRWCPWTFAINTTTITLVETNKLIIGAIKPITQLPTTGAM